MQAHPSRCIRDCLIDIVPGDPMSPTAKEECAFIPLVYSIPHSEPSPEEIGCLIVHEERPIAQLPGGLQSDLILNQKL